MSKEIINLSGKDNSPDNLLYESLNYMKGLPQTERTAVVAGVFNLNTQNLFVATSEKVANSNKIWNHAEFVALELAKTNKVNLRYALFISSLSACVRASGTRDHRSCTQVLLDSKFSSEHVGRFDRGAATPLQYQKMGLNISLSENPDILLVCDRLYDFFNRFKKNGRTKEQIISDALSFLPAKKTYR